MAKAINKIKEMAIVANLFIVVLDARAPITSYNDDFDQIAPHIPRLFLIVKTDLADSSKIQIFKKHFNNENDEVLIGSLKKQQFRNQILKVAMLLMSKKRESQIKKGIINPALKMIVVGMPNVGKSTLINLIALKTKTKVANVPAITRVSTWFHIDRMHLLDTPGILWPKNNDKMVITKLAIINILKQTLLPINDLFYESYKLISKLYPSKIEKIGLMPSFGKIEMYSQLTQLCENKKFVKKNGTVDINKGIWFFIDYVKKLKGVTYD